MDFWIHSRKAKFHEIWRNFISRKSKIFANILYSVRSLLTLTGSSLLTMVLSRPPLLDSGVLPLHHSCSQRLHHPGLGSVQGWTAAFKTGTAAGQPFLLPSPGPPPPPLVGLMADWPSSLGYSWPNPPVKRTRKLWRKDANWNCLRARRGIWSWASLHLR